MTHQQINWAVPGLKPVVIYQKKTEPCANIAKENNLNQINNTIQNRQQRIAVQNDLIIKPTNQNEIIMKTLADHKVLIERLLYKEDQQTNLASTFPVDSINGLESINKNINENNRKDYINVMKSLLKGRLPKTLTQVMSNNLCMEINLDGIHGKKRLKEFAAFYDALTDACLSLGLQEVEADLRNAIKAIEKRQIHAQCIKNKALKQKNSNA